MNGIVTAMTSSPKSEIDRPMNSSRKSRLIFSGVTSTRCAFAHATNPLGGGCEPGESGRSSIGARRYQRRPAAQRRSRSMRRSLSGLPPVWQSGQYVTS